jgi:uroporphyrinogen decarboxylase
MHLLAEGTPDQVDAAVRQAMDAAAAGGGYILCSSNSLHPGVNPENCIAMFQAAKQYGRYE